MTYSPVSQFEIYKLYLATAEKVSDRRAAANTWMLSVNSAIVALYGFLAEGSASVDVFASGIWLWAIPLAGIISCLAWTSLLSSYSKLNSAKFRVLHEIEKAFPFSPFEREQQIYDAMRRRTLSGVERNVPIAFIVLYGLILLASLAEMDFAV